MAVQTQNCVQCNLPVPLNDQFCGSCGTHQRTVAQQQSQPRNAELVQNQQDNMDQMRQRMATQMANEIADRMPQANPQSTLVNVSSPMAPQQQVPAQTINFNLSQPTPVYQQPVYYPPHRPTPSATFVVMTFVMYFLLFPVGVVMNWIGLLMGPYRGWHAVMFFLIQIPSFLLCIGIAIMFFTGALP